MSIGLKGENLIFLISQPRAGSTLLQNILRNHPDIHTTAEPWTMLHPLYALRSEGHEAEYNANWARSANNDFLSTLPDGRESYYESVRRMQTYLYNCSLENTGKKLFLDKTPRYYHIIPDLYRTFPNAYFIILLRNPLASFCSIINSWVKSDWLKLCKFRNDLMQAPRLLIEGSKMLSYKNHRIINYEQLLINPEHEIEGVCEALNVNYFPEMISSKSSDTVPKYGYGYKDQTAVFSKGKIDPENIQKWTLSLDDPQIWRFFDDYLSILDQEIVEQMGYSYANLRAQLDTNRPLYFQLSNTLPLEWCLQNGSSFEKLTKIYKEKGYKGALACFIHKIMRTVSFINS